MVDVEGGLLTFLGQSTVLAPAARAEDDQSPQPGRDRVHDSFGVTGIVKGRPSLVDIPLESRSLLLGGQEVFRYRF